MAVLAMTYSCLPLFWLTARALFDDGFRLKARYLIVLLGAVAFCFSTLATSRTAVWFYQLFADAPVAREWARIVLPQLLNFVFVGSAMYLVRKGADEDLVEPRLKMRRQFVKRIGLIALIITALEMIGKAFPATSDWLDSATAIYVFLVAYFLSLHLQGEGPSFLEVSSVTQVIPSPTTSSSDELFDQKLRVRFSSLIEKEKAYVRADLSVAILSDLLNEPEYKVRRYINRTLGFRNFNQFLNHYRVSEARRLLESDTEAKLPIYNLAIDLGYRSILPFNRAFKEATGMTPTQYRACRGEEAKGSPAS